MNKSHLRQGQNLSAIMTPDYSAEGIAPWRVGREGVVSIIVTQLAGPMGWYDCAVVKFDNGEPDIITPLHQCDYIKT